MKWYYTRRERGLGSPCPYSVRKDLKGLKTAILRSLERNRTGDEDREWGGTPGQDADAR